MSAPAGFRRSVGALLLLALLLAGSGCISRPATRSQPVPAPRPATPPPTLPQTAPATAPAASPGTSPQTAPPTLPPAAASAGVPARLTPLTPGVPGQGGVSGDCLAQIEAFAELHSGNRVMLGQAAFADSDQLVLMRAAARTPDGKRLDGRAAAGQPVVLYLLRSPRGCAIRLGGAPQPASAAGPGLPAAPASQPSSVGAGTAGTPLPACTCTELRP